MVFVVKIDNGVLDICKSYGVKNYSKLTKKRITDKNGHSRFVWVKINKEKVLKRTSNDDFIDNESSSSVKNSLINIKSVIETNKNNNLKVYRLLKNMYKILPENFNGFEIVQKLSDAEFNVNDKKIHILNCKTPDDYRKSVGIHEIIHAIDYYISNNGDFFSKQYKNFLGLYKINELPEKFTNMQQEYNNILDRTSKRLMEIDESQFASKDEYKNSDQVKEALQEKNDFIKRYFNNGDDCLADILDILNKEREEKPLFLPGTHAYMDIDNIGISELLSNYMVISFLFPEKKIELQEYVPGLINFADILIDKMHRELQL